MKKKIVNIYICIYIYTLRESIKVEGISQRFTTRAASVFMVTLPDKHP